MAVVDRPYLFPQRCYFTGNPNEEPIFDTQRNDQEGARIYINLVLLGEWAREAGFVSIAEANELRAENERLRAYAAAAPNIARELVHGIVALTDRAISDLGGNNSDAPDPVPPRAAPAKRKSSGSPLDEPDAAS